MTLRTCLSGSVLLCAAALGCGASSDGNSQLGTGANGGQTGEETIGCLPVQTEQLAWSEQSALGFSADELLNALGSEHETRLVYDDGTSTTLNLTLARAATGVVEFVERDWVSDNSGAELASAVVSECPDVVSIPVRLRFATGDNAFAEEWSFTLLAESTLRATAQVQLDLDALEGNFTVTQVNPAEFDDVLAYVALTLGSEGWSGTLGGQATKTTGQGPNGTSSAQMFDIASF